MHLSDNISLKFQEVLVVFHSDTKFLKKYTILLITRSLNYPLQANAQLLFQVCDAKIYDVFM